MAKSSKPTDESDTHDTESPPRLAQFESSVAELEALVEALESGDVSLEQALSKFERGVSLTRQCQTLLRNAELRVDQLLADTQGERVADFDADQSESDQSEVP